MMRQRALEQIRAQYLEAPVLLNVLTLWSIPLTNCSSPANGLLPKSAYPGAEF
jgi:hypothetical protein